MAKKNEVLLSIALEGDQEVKDKLKQVGEEGKRSLQNTEKSIADARNAAQRIAEPIGKVREALAPVIEQGGIAGALGGAGLGGLGGLISRVAAGFTSPAGLIAGIAGSLIGLAKLGEQTDRIKERLKGFGGGKKSFDDLTASAKKLGVSTEDLAPGLEDFQAHRRRVETEDRNLIHPPGYVPPEDQVPLPQVFRGGQLVSGTTGTDNQFLDAQGALLNASRLDKTDPRDALSAIRGFFASVRENGLTGDALRDLSKTSPSSANQVAASLGRSGLLGRGFDDFQSLATYQDTSGKQVGSAALIKSLSNDFEATQGPAQAARGVTDAFGALEAATKRLISTMGGDHSNLSKGIDAAAGFIDKAADKAPGLADQFLNTPNYEPGGGKFIGPVRPEDITGDNKPGGSNFIGPARPEDVIAGRAPQSLGEVFSSDRGDLLGRIVGYIRSGGAQGFDGGNPFSVITDFLSKAATNPGAIQEKQQKPQLFDPNPQYNWPIAPGGSSAPPPSPPPPPAPPEELQRVGNAVGIRGDASQSILSSGEKLASALDQVAARIESFQIGNSSGPVAALATGGEIKPFRSTQYEVLL